MQSEDVSHADRTNDISATQSLAKPRGKLRLEELEMADFNERDIKYVQDESRDRKSVV